MSAASEKILHTLGGEERLNHITMASHFLHGPTSLRFFLPIRQHYMEILEQSDGTYTIDFFLLNKKKLKPLQTWRDIPLEKLQETFDRITDMD